jgi:outer membrane protein, heavy metal efflux system
MSPYLLLPCVAAVCGAVIHAQNVSIEDLLREAKEKNPEILAAQKRVEAARLRPSQVSSLPDPMVSLASNSVKYPYPGAGLGREVIANIGVMAAQMVPAPGKLKLRGDIAYKDAEMELAQFHAVELAVAGRVKQAYIKLAYAQTAARILEKNRDLMQQLSRVTEARYTVGKAAQQDLFKAQTQISVMLAKLARMEQEARSARFEIGALLARPFTGDAAELKAFPFVESVDELVQAAESDSPMLARERKAIQKTEVAVNLARKDYYPDYTFSAGYYNMGLMPPMFMLRADITVPAFYFRKQRPAVAEAVTNVRQARRAYEAVDQSLRQRIQDDFLAASTAARLLRLYSDTVIPQAGLALESSLASYETGAVDFLSVLSNFTSVLEFEMNYAEEVRNLHASAARIEEMTGRNLSGRGGSR